MIDFPPHIHVYETKKLAWEAAGRDVEKCIIQLQERQEEIRMIFAAAPSQTGMLEYLANSISIRWEKVIAFHMDEYIGLEENAAQLFSKYLEEKLFSKVPLKAIHYIQPKGDLSSEIDRYTALLESEPIDIVCLGIGENGHIAFNDPPVADFQDPLTVKVVSLDEACRIQQVNDGCFESIDQVPMEALTLTIPALMSGKNLFCVVLGEKKSEAVKNTLTGPIETACPASILTTHPHCEFYFDLAAISKLADSNLSDR
ncbi:6-phosphogluconolactonase [Algoriphagus pacificus]|uniref:6-phosphogluconolactonase n=1 Tax=Algoriphagus pacificus TaxID=2811234 RepID=A0ABS3CGJ2_9BACT|nr:6-phosphogluconolactonase [Algoriphagus pacificus]MBN7816218.1 6-phosphogluconolactonase [Algoriphagus pacificus]